MSNKAARGTKRICQSCGARFYDLNRDPIICPVCGAQFRLSGEAAQAHAQRAAEAREQETEKSSVAETEGAEVIALDSATSADDEIPDIESGDLDDLDADSNLKSDEDALMPDDDSEDDDVSGFIDGSLEEDQDEDS